MKDRDQIAIEELTDAVNRSTSTQARIAMEIAAMTQATQAYLAEVRQFVVLMQKIYDALVEAKRK